MENDDATVNGGLAAALRGLCEEHGLVAMYVFGSRSEEIAALASGQAVRAAQPESDVDIGVQPQRGRVLSAAERVRLMQQLETLLDTPRVDLVILPEANAFLAA